jgi:nucleoside-triphosphatase
MKARKSTTHTLLITGTPGVGKTTVIRKVAGDLEGVRIGGFYTEELRSQGHRAGFRLVTFGGYEKVIAHIDFSHRCRVGKYGVDVAAIDASVDATLGYGTDVDLYLVDEIGKMECLSQRFVVAMRALLDGNKPVVATIGQKGEGFIREVKQRNDAVLWQVTHENRDSLAPQILAWLESRAAWPGQLEPERLGP